MQTTPKKHWRSLAELEGAPEFQELLTKEFPGLVPETDVGELDGVTRRRFLQVMGASMALAGASSCRWEAEEILPFASRPMDRIPGKAQHYASALVRSGHGVGVTLTTYDGRPIKVEGNPNELISGGATDVFAQAAILELYDPDRSRTVLHNGKPSTFEKVERAVTDEEGEPVLGADGEPMMETVEGFDAFWAAHVKDTLKPSMGQGLAFLSEASHSPTEGFLKTLALRGFKNARWVEYEPVSRDHEIEGAKAAFGEAVRAQYNLAATRVVVSFDGDLFSNHPAQLKHNREWALVRNPKSGEMGRMYAAESRFSTDGGMADHRVPMRSGDVPAFVALVEAILAEEHQLALADSVKLADLPAAHGATDAKARGVARAIAKDLAAHAGRSLLVAGPNQPAEVHARLHHLNALLGNVGRTVTYTEEPAAERPGHAQALRELVAAMNAGEISTLVIVEGNAAYDAPADVDFAAALAGVAHTVRLGLYANETSSLCGWHVPRTHAFEAWGDAMAWDGSHLIGQPTIAPIWGARSLTELLGSMIPGTMPTGDKLIGKVARLTDKPMRKAIHDGVAPTKLLAAKSPTLKAPGKFLPVGVGDSIEVTFSPDSKVWDGRFANSAWLQELPDFMTKLTWDNVALVAPKTAEKLGVTTGDMLSVSVEGRAAELPVYVMPGQAQDSIGLALGYGRTRAGKVGGWDVEGEAIAPVGVNVYPLQIGRAHV